MSDCVLACPERSGLCTSTFWSIAGGSQIFSYLFNSIILGNFNPSLIFIITSAISLIAIISFALLPQPLKPEGYIQANEKSAKETFMSLIDLLVREKRTLQFYGVFFSSATINAIANGFLLPFYC